MTKYELVDKIFIKADLPSKAKAEEALESVLSVLKSELLAGENVTFSGFGSFKIAERRERKGRNPATGEEMLIPATKAIKFTAGKALKDAVN